MDIYSAREEGVKQGIAQEKHKMVRTTFSNGAGTDAIAHLIGLLLEDVSELLSQELMT